MKTDYSEIVKTLKQELINFFNSGEEVFKCEHFPFSVLYELQDSKTLKVEFDGDYWDTNGWQHDFWIDFKVNGTNYKVSGSWAYGDFKIEKDVQKE